MAGLKMRLTRTMSLSSRRFLRDVAASLLATGVASVAFSHLSHERAPSGRGLPPGAKYEDRLSWKAEDVPTRQTTTFDTVAMFSLPLAIETAWSEPTRTEAAAEPTKLDTAKLETVKLETGKLDPSRAEAVRITHVRTASTARPAIDAAEPKTQRLAAAVPPSRPAAFAPGSATAAAIVAQAEPSPIRVLGWAVPGSDLLPSPPEAMQRMASLGGRVASFGGSLVETVGLR